MAETDAFPVTLGKTKHPVLMWARHQDIESAALEQLHNIGNLPWVHGVRVMPDVHLGKGATVGSVIAMKQAVSPSAVGVDIGCGMAAVRTSLTLNDLPDDLHSLRTAIEAAVPVGYNGNKGTAPILRTDYRLNRTFTNLLGRFSELRAPRIADRESKAASQCGSLGGGNHFIELCAAEGDEHLWLTLHSGSRNIGKELAERHMATAKTLEHNLGLRDRNLAVFLAGTEEMEAYLHDLWWAQDYAMTSRSIMLATVERVLIDWWAAQSAAPIGFDEPILCHHNYVATETYDGVELIVTRKGAIRAGAGDLGIIPGSMGTGSYIVEGLGNLTSYNSASHGAGRRMSRTAAKKQFTVEDLAQQTDGIECRKDKGVIDEIPAAYKSIESVMEAQADLVRPLHRLTTLLCVKG